MRLILVILSFLIISSEVSGSEGTHDYASKFSVDETIDRLETVVEDAGMTVFARIDHAAGARRVDMDLRPTELLIFGSPGVGTLLMQSNQLSGIDLPLKALAWQDECGNVWLTLTTGTYIAGRHDIRDRQPVIDKMNAAMAKFAIAATR